jgi:hypothetical protein
LIERFSGESNVEKYAALVDEVVSRNFDLVFAFTAWMVVQAQQLRQLGDASFGVSIAQESMELWLFSRKGYQPHQGRKGRDPRKGRPTVTGLAYL